MESFAIDGQLVGFSPEEFFHHQHLADGLIPRGLTTRCAHEVSDSSGVDLPPLHFLVAFKLLSILSKHELVRHEVGVGVEHDLFHAHFAAIQDDHMVRSQCSSVKHDLLQVGVIIEARSDGDFLNERALFELVDVGAVAGATFGKDDHFVPVKVGVFDQVLALAQLVDLFVADILLIDSLNVDALQCIREVCTEG